MLVIGGLTVHPSDFEVSINDVVENASRNANANLIAERISTKRKLEIKFKIMTQAECVALYTIFSASFFVSVTYCDPLTGSTTKTFYPSDRKNPMSRYRSGVPIWKDVSFSLVEQ